MDVRLQKALEFAAQGYKILPQTIDKKVCLKWENRSADPSQIEQWYTKEFKNCNFAVETGEINGIIALDIDVKNGQPGKASLEKLKVEYGNPMTLTVRTPSGGTHYFFKCTDGKIKTLQQIKDFPGIEVKGERGMITLPGGQRDGKEYTITAGHIDAIAPLPPKLSDLLHSNSYVKKEKNLSPISITSQIPEGQRNVKLTQIAGKFYRNGNRYDTIMPVLEALNTMFCKPPLPIQEVESIVRSVCGYVQKDAHEGDGMSDLGNARRLCALHGQDIRYCYPFKKWFTWTGSCWEEDRIGQMKKYAVDVVRNIYREAATLENKDARKALAAWAARCESKVKLDAMIQTAEFMVPILPEDFDTHTTKVNLKNGVYNLKDDTIAPPDRELYFTKETNVALDQDAECPRFEQFISEIFNGNEETIHFIQKALGYSLSGETTQQCIFICYGIGQNGKSTLLETVAKVMGDFFCATPTESLMSKRSGGVPNDIARLRGIRFTTALESEENRRLAEPLIKSLTGGDTISARFLFAEYFDFVPQFKIWIATNHKPKITGTDVGIWRRIRLIPFNVQFPPGNRDGNLKEKLELEGPGILKWMIVGYAMYKAEGLKPPEEIRQATNQYKNDQDTFLQYMTEQLVRDPAAVTKFTEIYSNYREWSEENGEHSQSKKWVSARLEEHGIPKLQNRDGIFWETVKIRECEA